MILGRMIARAAGIIGQPMTWIYREFTFPELAFVLHEAERTAASSALTVITGQSLGAAALWSKDAGTAYREFMEHLSEFVHGPAAKHEIDDMQAIRSMFAQIGVGCSN